MSATLYSRQNYEDRGHGLLILTQCSNGVGKSTRLELYASRGLCLIYCNGCEEAWIIAPNGGTEGSTSVRTDVRT